MKATLRPTFMRLMLMTTAIGLLLHATLIDQADLPFALAIMMAIMIYEALYQLASRSVRDWTPGGSTGLSH